MTSDPRAWNTDTLIDQLCRSTDVYKIANCDVPDSSHRSSLEEALRRKRMTGASIFEDTDAEVSEIMGPRTYVCVLRLLRSQSMSHQQQVAANGVQRITINSPTKHQNAAIIAGDDGRKRRRIALETIEPGTKPNLPQSTVETEQTWDHLRHWQQDEEVSDGEEPLDETSDIEEPLGEEEDEEEDDEMELEVETELQNPSRVGKLSHEEVISIINDSIEEFTAKWKPDKEQLAESKVLLDNATTDGDHRQQLINEYHDKIDYLQSRLDRLGDHILHAAWNTEGPLRRMCKTLEGSVDNLQEAEWLLAMLESGPEVEDVRNVPTHMVEIIDLGSESDSPDDQEDNGIPSEHSPEVDGARPSVEGIIKPSIETQHATSSTSTRTANPRVSQDNPSQASIRSVRDWDWDLLVMNKDRKRIVMKVISEMSAEDRETIRSRINNIPRANLFTEISGCIAMLEVEGNGKMKMPGVLPRDLPKIIAFTKLFLSWWTARNCFHADTKEWRPGDLSQALHAGSEDRHIFCDWVHHIFKNTFSMEALRKPLAPSQSEVIVISDDDD